MLRKDIDLAEPSARKQVGVLLVPGFSVMSYASLIEPFRAANLLSGRNLYAWCHLSSDGAPARASNGIMIAVDHAIGQEPVLDTLFVCAAGNPSAFRHRPTLQWLRRIARKGPTEIGGVSGGPFILARAGLLRERRCTIHWEHIPAFKEAFPDLDLTRTLYEIDRGRLTCAGGIAALDMAHAIIAKDHGTHLATAVSEWFLQTDIRSSAGAQRVSLRERYGISNERLLRVLERMELQIEQPADRRNLAALAGISPRQLDRLFRDHLGRSLGQTYLAIRLDRARSLLRQTTMSVLATAVSCGFTSQSLFSRSYRERFGRAPSADRADGA